MKLVFICWYISILLMVTLIGSSFVTLAPDPKGTSGFALLWVLFQAVDAIAACSFAAAAIFLSTRWRSHRIHQSRLFGWTCLSVAAFVTFASLVTIG